MSLPLATEADAVADAIIDILLADTGAGGVVTLIGAPRIYRDVSPTEATPYPMVTVSVMSAEDVNTADGTHVMQNIRAMVVVTDVGNDSTKLRAIAARVGLQINMQERITKHGVYIAKIWRTGIVPMPSEFVNSRRYLYHAQQFAAVGEPE